MLSGYGVTTERSTSAVCVLLVEIVDCVFSMMQAEERLGDFSPLSNAHERL